jgi:hypothetical protein
MKKHSANASMNPVFQKQQQRKDHIEQGVDQKSQAEEKLPGWMDGPVFCDPDEPDFQECGAEKLERKLALGSLAPQRTTYEVADAPAWFDLFLKDLIAGVYQGDKDGESHPTTASEHSQDDRRDHEPFWQRNGGGDLEEDDA